MIPVDFDNGRAPAPPTPAQVEQNFAKLGQRPPAAYVEFVIANGGTRFPSSARYVRNADSGEPIGLSTVYHHDPAQPFYSVQDVWEQTGSELPEGLVPIMSAEVNGEVCLDYRNGGEPGVVFYDYDAEPGREIGRLAESFDRLIERVGPNPAA